MYTFLSGKHFRAVNPALSFQSREANALTPERYFDVERTQES